MALVQVRCWYNINVSTAYCLLHEESPRLIGAWVCRLCAEALIHSRTTCYIYFSVRFAASQALEQEPYMSMSSSIHRTPMLHGIQ